MTILTTKDMTKVKVYLIMWRSQYGTEQVDETTTKEDANYLVNQYQLAYGEGRVYKKAKFINAKKIDL